MPNDVSQPQSLGVLLEGPQVVGPGDSGECERAARKLLPALYVQQVEASGVCPAVAGL